MSKVFKGAIIQWVSNLAENHGDCSASPHEPLLECVLYVGSGEYVILIGLNEGKGLPYHKMKREIEEALDDGSAVRRSVHPYAKYICPDETFLEKHVHIRDRAWNIIKDIVVKEPDIYLPESRGALIKNAIDVHKVTKMEVYKFLKKYWMGGCVRNALLPAYDNCGAPGKERKIEPVEQYKLGKESVKRGRPSKLSNISPDYKGVNVTEDTKNIFKIAIKLYFEKQGNRSLKAAYDQMRINFFNVGKRVERGAVVQVMPPSYQIPTYGQFLYWHKKLQDFSKSLRKRLGENAYNLTAREILGDSTQQASGPGALYQIDATIADVYLVSLLDPFRIIGRPVVYFVKDVFSRMIVGLYVGLESPSWTAAMMAIANTAADKVAFCAEYGIEIDKDEWPCHHLCEKFVGDGGELLSINSDALIDRLNIGVANCPPYRGDFKGIVERQFGIVNEKVIEWLPGAVHEFRMEQRDHRLDATLNIHQFIRIIIMMALEHNQCQWLKDYRLEIKAITEHVDPIPIKLWNWGIANRSGCLREKTQDVVKLALMPRGIASVTEKGICFKKMYYTCDLALRQQWFVKARMNGRWSVEVSYDVRKADVIYLINQDNTFEPCNLVDPDARFKGASIEEIQDFFEIQDIKSKLHETERIQSAARLHGMIEAQLAEAKARKKGTPRPEKSKSKRLKEIPTNRLVAKEMARGKEAFDLRKPCRNDAPAKILNFSGDKKDEPKVRTSEQQKKDLLAVLKESEKGES